MPRHAPPGPKLTDAAQRIAVGRKSTRRQTPAATTADIEPTARAQFLTSDPDCITGKRQADVAPNARIHLLTAIEVAARLKISLREVRRFIASGALVVHRFGRAVRVSEADLERFLRRHRGGQ